MQFNEVAKLHPRVTESSAITCYFSIYVSQAGGGGTAGADVMMSFAIASLEKIFKESTPSDTPWKDIESFFKHIGFEVKCPDGSAVVFCKDNHRPLFFHKPHPQRQAKRGVVRAIRDFLESIGVKP